MPTQQVGDNLNSDILHTKETQLDRIPYYIYVTDYLQPVQCLPTNPNISSQSTTFKNLALITWNKDNSWSLGFKGPIPFLLPWTLCLRACLDPGLDQVPRLAIKLFHLVHNLWSQFVIMPSLTGWRPHRDHVIESRIKTDRPPTLKNLSGPRFSRFLETSDGDSADFSSEFVLFCSQVCVYSGSEPPGFSG